MAVITSASSGNFSAPATWVGGVVPGVNDDAVAATTHVVTIDVDVTVLSFQQAGTGKFVLGNGRTVTGNVIANAGTFTSGGTIEVTATTTATINGNLSGASSTANNISAVVITGMGTLTINGNITGSAGNNSSAANRSSMVYTNVTCTLNVNGSLTGGTGQNKGCIQGDASSNIAITVIGNIVGGQPNTHAVLCAGPTASITVQGNVTGGQDSSGIQFSGASATGNVTGAVAAASGNNSVGVYFLGTSAQVTITGSVTGGAFNTGVGVRLNGGSANVTVIGDVTGSSTGNSAHGIWLFTGPSANVTGSVSGGTGGSNCHGIRSEGSGGTITVTGPVSAGIGSGAFGISAIFTGTQIINVNGPVLARRGLRHGISAAMTVGGVILQGDMTDAIDGTVAIYTRLFRVTATANGVTKYASGLNAPFGTLVSRVAPSNSAGMPAISNVRSGTIYGAVNEFTGTVAVPTSSQVMYGVPVDGSTGIAEFDLVTVADIVQAQVSAGAYERTIL